MARDPRRPRRDVSPGVKRADARSEVDEEIRIHLDTRIEALVAKGWGQEEAEREALRRFGDVEATRAALVRSTRRWGMKRRKRMLFDDLVQDLRIGLRSLVKSPGFSGGVIGTLALGIAGAALVLTVADQILLRPLPYTQPDRAVALFQQDLSDGTDRIPLLAGDFLRWKEAAEAAEYIALAEPFSLDMTTEDRTISLPTWLVTSGWFEALGLEPAMGRTFEEADGFEGAEFVLVVSHRFWQRHMGGDPDAVGSLIEVEGVSARVVGILPDVPHWPYDRDVYTPRPERERDLTEFGRGYMQAIARLADGASQEDLAAQLDLAAAEVRAQHPPSETLRPQLVSLREHMMGDVGPMLTSSVFGALILLLIACANASGVLLARGLSRQREYAIRAALGARMPRLARQLLVEHGILGILAGVIGAGLAYVGLRAGAPYLADSIALARDLSMDSRALGLTLSVALVSTLAIGLLPILALRSGHGEPQLQSGRGRSESRGSLRTRRALVVLEVASAVVVLVGAGLLGRSFLALTANDPGFQPDGIVALQAHIWGQGISGAERIQNGEAILESMSRLPGVSAVGMGTSVPFFISRIDVTAPVGIDGRSDTDEGAVELYSTIVDPGYFSTLEIPLLAGRTFEPTDDGASELVAVINERGARRLFPGEDPIGRIVTFGAMGRTYERRIVGVVGDVRTANFETDPNPELFVPFRQSGNGSLIFMARAADPGSLVRSMEEALWAVDPSQAIYDVAVLSDHVAATMSGRRFQLALGGGFSILALILAGVGLFGLLSYSAALRSREMGIRIALGAERSDVVRRLMGDGIGLAVIGAVLGAIAAMVFTPVLGSSLYGIQLLDPWTYVSIGGLILAVSTLASALPAARAARLDPVRTLGEE